MDSVIQGLDPLNGVARSENIAGCGVEGVGDDRPQVQALGSVKQCLVALVDPIKVSDRDDTGLAGEV